MKYPFKNSSSHAVIYVLTDNSYNIFYVGCTTIPIQERLANHITEARRNYSYTNTVKNEKIRSLNYKVFIKEIDRIPVNASNGHYANRQGRQLEMKYIVKYHQMGCCLVNGPKEIKRAYAALLEQEVTTNEG